MAKSVLSRRILAIVALKKREELKDEKVGWLIAGIFEKKGEQNKNRKKAPLEKINSPSEQNISKPKFEQKSNIPLESSSVSLVLEKLFIVGWLKMTVSSPCCLLL